MESFFDHDRRAGIPVTVTLADGSTAEGYAQGVISADVTASGTITTQNLVPAGTATTGSAVEIDTSGMGTVTVQVTGTYTGALSPQVTTNGTTWVTQTSTQTLLSMADGTYSATIPSGATGIWQVEVTGHSKFRITALAAVTGTATVTLRASSGTGQVVIASGIVEVTGIITAGQGDPGGQPWPVIVPGNYETVAASATGQVLGGTGATGDYLQGLLVVPATTSPGNVLVLDNATSITVFAGGASSVGTLIPFFIPIGAYSVSGAWKVTTGTNVSVVAIGRFTA